MLETDSVNTGEKNTQFQKGNRGRPKGSKNWASRLAEQMLEDECENIVRALIKAAVEDGDVSAMRTCVERLLPPRRDRPIEIDLPNITTMADLLAATKVVTEAMASGELTPLEAQSVSSQLDSLRQNIQVATSKAYLDYIDERFGMLYALKHHF